MADLPKKVGNLTPQEFKRAINETIAVIEANQLHLLATADLSTATNGEQLTYNSTTGKWEPAIA